MMNPENLLFQTLSLLKLKPVPIGATRRWKRSVLDPLLVELINSQRRYARVAQTKHGLLQVVLRYYE